MIRSSTFLLALSSLFASGHPTLSGAFKDDFLIGTAVNTRMVDGSRSKAGEVAARHFDSLTPENDMKWERLHPQPDQYTFEAADKHVAFGERHGMAVIGHTLVWHSQTPEWVFKGKDGAPATREELLERMREHILIVAGRYKGKVKGWDVVNEAISDGPGGLRDSPWRKIIGDDFIDHAFRYAREADPQAELYYNDYGLENPEKRARAVKMLKGLIERKVPITGVGTQAHWQLDHPAAAEIERTIQEFSALGLKVMVTELDVDVLPSRGNSDVADISRREKADSGLDPYREGLPDEMQQKLARRYGEVFEIFIRHRKDITRVTLWGLDDGQSWLNHFPIRGRTNHPLLFSRELLPKPAFFEVLKKGEESGADQQDDASPAD
ncbi:MAG: endo-1,4-beta-xylanase [Verrucomicrobiaceae bacterium]|nr:MAG: endo-1,4-beta-xylanase [Verrucomicrobiaceae bacterium]